MLVLVVLLGLLMDMLVVSVVSVVRGGGGSNITSSSVGIGSGTPSNMSKSRALRRVQGLQTLRC